MPDIDIDFDERRRGDMIRYVTEKYGDDRVAQIVTYGTIKAKRRSRTPPGCSATRSSLGDRITKVMPPPVMGKDIPLAGIFDPSHERYGEAGEFRALVRRRRRRQEGRRHRARARGAQAAVGRARRRRDHVPRAAARRDPDQAARAGRRDHHPVRHARLRVARPAQDGLPRPAQPHRPRRLPRQHQGQPRRGPSILEDLDLDATRRPTSCWAAATRSGVFQLDGGAMRVAAAARCGPTSFEDISAVGALYRPGPMGANAHNDYADRKNGRKPVVPIHPELAEPLAEILDETYGLIVYQEQVMAIAQKVAGYSLGQADLLRRAMGKKKKEILDKEYVPFSAGMQANGLQRRRDQDAVGHPGPVLRLRVQQGAHAPATAWSPTGPPTSRRTTRPSTWPRCSPRSGRQGQERALPRRVPADGHQGAAAGRQRVRLRLHPARHRHPVRPVRDPQRRRRTSSPRSSRPAASKGASPTSPTSCARSSAVVCNKRTVESLIKAGAFDSLGHTRRGLLCVHAEAIDAVSGHQARRGDRPVRPVRRRR